MKPRIVCAAILMDDGLVLTGARHLDGTMEGALERIYGKEGHKGIKEQGFIDQFGTFYSRKDAWKIADAQGQIIRETGFENEPVPRKANIGDDGILFSENLY